MNAQNSSADDAEQREARAASALARPSSRARAVSHLGSSTSPSDGSGRAAASAAEPPAIAASGIQHLDQLARRVLARESQEDLLEPVVARSPPSRAAPPSCRRRGSFRRAMIAMRSHSVSATSSVCVLIMIVWPRRVYSRNRSLRMLAALGSRPTIGSSTTITSGRCTNALEMMSFWRMPWL